MKKFLLSAICLLLAFSVFPQQWTVRATYPKFDPNQTSITEGLISFGVGDKFYMGSGARRDNVNYKDMWEYNIHTSTWLRKADFPGPAGRTTGVVFV